MFGVEEWWVQEDNAQLQLPKDLAGGRGPRMSLLGDTLWDCSKGLQSFTKQNRAKDHLVLPLHTTGC